MIHIILEKGGVGIVFPFSVQNMYVPLATVNEGQGNKHKLHMHSHCNMMDCFIQCFKMEL